MSKLLLLAALLSAACNGSPTAPSALVTLSITVMGNQSKQPIPQAPVSLAGTQSQLTDQSGKAYWRVEPGREYQIDTCGQQGTPHLVTGPGEVGWLTSLPERLCKKSG